MDEPRAATDTIIREVRVVAPRAEVFAYFIDPAKMIRWKARAAWLDARPGGLFRIDVNGLRIARGKFVEIDPPSRVVFTWGWENGEFPPGSSLVEITFKESGDETVVRLVHRGIPAEHVESNGAGWDHYLARLQAAAAGRDPGPDPRAAG